MKSLIELLNEAIKPVNEGSHASMEICKDEKEAIKKAIKFEKCGAYITYVGPDPEVAAEEFEMNFDVSTYLDEQSRHLYIPCTTEVEYAICNDDETQEEHCQRMGLNPEDFEF